jgi:hypothetical protein
LGFEACSTVTVGRHPPNLSVHAWGLTATRR